MSIYVNSELDGINGLLKTAHVSEKLIGHPIIDWSSLTPTLVGGFITIVAAFIAFGLANRAERKRREQDEANMAAANAIAGYFKLLQWVNLVANIKSHIDKSYAQANDFNIIPHEPALIVGPSAGLFAEPNRLEPEEYRFLLSKKNMDVITNMFMVEQRAINTHFLFQKYTEMNLEFQVWLDGLPGFERILDGPFSKDSIPAEFIPRFDVRIAQLNRIIIGIIEHIDGDLNLAAETLQSFANIGHEKYGELFPEMKIKEAVHPAE